MSDTRITIDEVKKLAVLARIAVPEAELPKIAKDLEQIIGYISLLEKAPVVEPTDRYAPPLSNVFRADGEPHDSDIYRTGIISNFPHKSGDYLSVKEVISYK